MPVDPGMQAECDGRSQTCGMAMACLGERCGPCGTDADCASGEVCVLEHCLLREHVACRHQADCGGEMCILSGYSADVRGNADMRAECLSKFAATEDEALAPPPPPINEGPRAEDTYQMLRRQIAQ
jgi:Cys-rich repeat protein